MLDLKKLEKNLDMALSNETSESLTNWLQEKRLRSFLQHLGDGTFENISPVCSDNILNSVSVSFEVQYNEVSYLQEYSTAA